MGARSTGGAGSGAGGPQGRLNSLGLSRKQLKQVVAELDRRGQISADRAGATAPDPGVAQRQYARWTHTAEMVPVEIRHPGGSHVRLRLAARNISAGGVSLLHNGYLHPGSEIRVFLMRAGGGALAIEGAVRRCLHVSGVIHELGVQFHAPVDLHQIASGQDEERFTLESVDPEKLEGRVVYVGGTQLGRNLFRHLMRKTSLRIAEADTADKAIEAIGGGCDALIADVTGDVEPAVTLRCALAAEGVTLPTIAVYRAADAASREAAASLGATIHLAAPLVDLTLRRAMGEILLLGAKGESEAA